MTEEIRNRIQEKIDHAPVVIFMKGTPEAPMCGFSRATVDTLRTHGKPFASVDVLADEAIREGIKTFSSWPTIPQVYVRGEFVGGCDIVLELHRSGELARKLEGA